MKKAFFGSFFVLMCAISMAPCRAAVPSPDLPGLGDRVPWISGEQLTYDVSWGLILAAQGVFNAQPTPERPRCWNLDLQLTTLAAVDALYPVQAHALSSQQTKPWRSLQFSDQRSEGGEVRNWLTAIDYPKQQGILKDQLKKTQKIFPFQTDSLNDLVSTYYGLRTVDWKEGVKRSFWVYEEDDVKRAEAYFVGRETIYSTAAHKKVPCVVIWARPIYKDPKKNARGLGARIWISDDIWRRPIRADMKLKFGSVRVDLVKETPPVPL